MSTVYIRFAARPPPTLVRAPLLERLLARADAQAGEVDWRARAFRLIAPEAPLPPVASAALHGSAQDRTGGWALIASPVHLVAGMSSVRMPADGLLDIEPAEAEGLAADFNRVFEGGGVRLIRGVTAPLLCLFDAPLSATTTDPQEVLGEDIGEFLPHGADSAQLRRLMSEMEMWLFAHTVNEGRRARRAPPISGFWLWGGGASGAPLPPVQGWAAGADPLFSAFAGPAFAGPAFAGPAGAAGGGGPGVAVISDWPGSAGWAQAERDWLAPAAGALRSGRLERLDLSAGRRRFSVSARGMLRFWRRPRPWWESLDVRAGEGER